jgi:hypothetical protein
MTETQRKHADRIFDRYQLNPAIGTIEAVNGWESGGDPSEPHRITRTIFIKFADALQDSDTVRAVFALAFADAESTSVLYAQLEGIEGANPVNLAPTPKPDTVAMFLSGTSSNNGPSHCLVNLTRHHAREILRIQTLVKRHPHIQYIALESQSCVFGYLVPGNDKSSTPDELDLDELAEHFCPVSDPAPEIDVATIGNSQVHIYKNHVTFTAIDCVAGELIESRDLSTAQLEALLAQ